MEIIKDKFTDVELLRNDETTIMTPCFGCHEEIESHSWYYVYKARAFKLKRAWHKFCLELPTEMEHPLHPLHLQRLDWLHVRCCDFCKRSGGWQWMYACSTCKFYVCLMCGGDVTLKVFSSKSPEEREMMKLKDLSHHHQLKLLQIQNRVDDDYGDDNNVDVATTQLCKACLQPIIEASYYICTEEYEGCNEYSLHEFCAELPLQMEHELHPLHPLLLMLSPPLEHFKCFACRKFCQGHIYSCRICSFQLDIICATTMSRVLEHKCHPHPLTLLPRPISSFCDACSRVHEGIFYQCTTCVVFFIHQDCASLGYVIFHSSHPGHPLRLGFRSNGIEMRNSCDICYQEIYDKSGWFYYCSECKFYSHLNCIRSSDNYEEIQEIGPEIPSLPWEGADNEFGIVGLLNRNLKSVQSFEDSEMDTINHFSHPQHPLVCQSDVPREANPYSDGEITLTAQCNGCCKPISAPLYSCVSCHFYLHKSCALLPFSIPQHSSHSKHHNSRLVLLREPWSETRVFICTMCQEECNGLSFQCEEESCSYIFDVECAFLPISIVHKAHPLHPLHLVHKARINFSLSPNRLKCCSRGYLTSRYLYICGTCGVMIHTDCAMYPAKAHHRFDCDRPFMLHFNASVIEPNEYHYCDICEEILNPKKWFYFSPKNGGQIMHHPCLFHRHSAAVKNPNYKAVSSVFEVDIHPHHLHLYPTSSYSSCFHCSMIMKDHKTNSAGVQEPFELSYQCGDCRYELHVRCANKFILRMEEDCHINVDKVFQQLYLEGSGSNEENPDNAETRKGKEIL